MSNPSTLIITLNIPAAVAHELQALLNIHQRANWANPSPVEIITDLQKLDAEALTQLRNHINEQL